MLILSLVHCLQVEGLHAWSPNAPCMAPAAGTQGCVPSWMGVVALPRPRHASSQGLSEKATGKADRRAFSSDPGFRSTLWTVENPGGWANRCAMVQCCPISGKEREGR